METGQKRHPGYKSQTRELTTQPGTILSTLCASELFLLPTLLTANMWDFPSNQLILQLSRYQLGSLQFNSNTCYLECRHHRSHKTAPLPHPPCTSDANFKSQVVICTSSEQTVRMAHRIQESALLTVTSLLQRPQIRKSQMEERYRARGGVGCVNFHALSGWVVLPALRCVH